MKTFHIHYRFTLPDGSEERFDLEIDRKTLELIGNTPAVPPPWTKLDFHQCPNCPLKSSESPHCPLALNLVNLVTRFDGLISHDVVDMEVATEERTISETTTAQKGISSLMGLVIATSGCPHTTYLRPMARFHLPLASSEETIYRAASMYLLSQYFVMKSGGKAELELDGLTKIYKEMGTINISIADRLRSATTTDSTVNAIVVLDVYAKMAEMVIGGALESIRYLFTSYFTPQAP